MRLVIDRSIIILKFLLEDLTYGRERKDRQRWEPHVYSKKSDRMQTPRRPTLEPRRRPRKACASTGKKVEEQRLKIRLYGYLRSVAGRFEIDERIRRQMTILEVINELLDPLVSGSLMSLDRNASSSGFLFLLNGKNVNLLDGLHTAVSDRDELAIIPVSHGG
ncbi:MAG: MoaD/ThiS family protein [Aigarchaeota archaeon]|nr:MoaD/ThiS family protein [Aigarchaeota archaeon]MDH5703228.1 MoaD/ThiS family protein [Aigarchaeota archaeon]